MTEEFDEELFNKAYNKLIGEGVIAEVIIDDKIHVFRCEKEVEE